MMNDRLTFDEVMELIGWARRPAAWQQRVVSRPTFPRPVDGLWNHDEVLAWCRVARGLPADWVEPVELTRDELEDETVSLTEDLIDAICEAAGYRCQCDRANCHPSSGRHGVPVQPPRLKIYPLSGRWPRPVGSPSAYGLLCVSCGKQTPWTRARIVEDDDGP
jgi:hypothetical protein